ncbi:MAG TPA: lysylphosphatidylglycerol synthase domain-containing protein [Thermoanaerobaculia bacterium]|nr:lysylphosphatidylglycerol synthase domain-containing protein [Thermoanaerobaculia bacterium]
MGRLKRWLPWGVAVALLAVLFTRIPFEALREALAHGSYLTLALYVLFEIVIALAPDAWATKEALAAAGVRKGFRELMLARGATYLLGLLSYLLGQGGVGVWLAKRGVRAAQATGAVLLLMVSNGIVLLLIAGAGLLVSHSDKKLLLVVGAGLAAVAVYLTAIGLRVEWLRRWEILAPLFDAGLSGHLRAIVARLPHMLLLAVLHWGAFRIWGIGVPPEFGIALMPVVLLIAALPITPGGLGSTQALQVLFFAPWAAGPTAEARAADVLAFSLVHHVLSLLAMALVGLVCLAFLQREER